MEANCLNESCEKEQWRLRKHPQDYARGGPTCPECGTSKVEITGAEQQNGQQPQQAQPQQAQPPAQQQPQQQQGAQPAVPQDGDAAIAQGMKMGSMLYQMGSDDDMERAEATGELLRLSGAAAAKIGEEYVSKKRQQRQRAKSMSNDDISVAEDYPECPNCASQLKGIPSSGEFPCPACGVMLEA